MTEQEAYEKIRAHFADEGNPFPAVKTDEEGYEHCVYREEREDGTVARCAVGCLISDEQYEDWEVIDFEGSTSDMLITENNHAREAFEDVKRFLGSVQGLHDSFSDGSNRGRSREDFIQELDRLVLDFGLEVKH